MYAESNVTSIMFYIQFGVPPSECARETNNTQDPYAVVVMRSSTIVGHVPRKILGT